MSKTIIVSNRLPVSIEKEGEKIISKPSAGGLATGLGSIYKSGDNIWVGWPGLFPENEQEASAVTKELTKDSMRPVFLSNEEYLNYYEGFSNSTIWPQFHYFTQYTEFNQDYWDAYVQVNEKFCEAILQYAEDGDIIWVQDYQLLLLPKLLREKLPSASIGYFHHIPFPSYEIFRMLPWRKEMLEGVLGADMIGYHTYDDMRHFLSAVSRIVGPDHEMGHLRHDDRIITVDALPMGIDYEKFEKAAISKETQREIKEYYASMHTKQLMLSIDRLDYSKGIPGRLKALDKFYEKYPEFQGKVSLILLVVPSRDQVESYAALKNEIELLVGRINGKYSAMNWTPVHYFYRSLPFSKLSALYSMSDVALVTPLRDGMNLVAKEFVASKLDQTGVLILSEMAGAAKELNEAIIINPNDQDQLVEAMHEALTMPQEEQTRRITDLQDKTRRYDIHKWVKVFMKGLEETKEKQNDIKSRLLKADKKKKIVDACKASKKRLFLLDYDGTLAHFHTNPTEAKPDEQLLKIMADLTSDPNNHIVVISGRDRHSLQKWLGEFDVEFIAEHGVWYKEKGSEWEMADDLALDWKDEIQPILDLYVDRTPGSLIEEKDYSLVWHFRKADAEFGEMRARELVSNLQYLTSNMDIQILEGNKVIEIKNAGINKGKAAMKWLNKENWDFIFAAGDDWTDEDTFHVLPKTAYSLKVGTSSSEARYNIKSVDHVRALLEEFGA